MITALDRADRRRRTCASTTGRSASTTLLLLSASGMVMLAHAANLVTVFLGIETMSIGVYVMTRDAPHARAAATKPR